MTHPDSEYYTLAFKIAGILEEKRKAYGPSFESAGKILAILYPDGIHPNQYGDILCVIRITEKLFRIATDKDAFGESPYEDLAGYSILGAVNDHRKNNKSEIPEAPKGPRLPSIHGRKL